MPPKKPPAKGAKDEPVEDDDGAERELVEKELIIGYLKNKLGRYQEHGDQLQVDNIKLTEELENQKLKLKDINDFLTHELKARSLTTMALEAKVYELDTLVEDMRKNHEAALGKLRTDKDKEMDVLRGQLAEYEKKARIMQDFLDRKDNLESEIANLRAELAAKIKDYEYRLTDLDRSHIQEREKWKREMNQRIKETKIQMMKLTDNQLEMTTKRTIMENEQMSIELHYQSRQTEKLMNKNTTLVEENHDLRRQLALSRQTQEELAKRNNVYQKTIKSLLMKLQEQGQVQDLHEPVIKALEERVQDLEMAQHLAQLQSDEQQEAIQKLQDKLAAAKSSADSASAAQDTAVRLLTQCLEDVRSRVVTEHDDDRPPGWTPAPPQQHVQLDRTDRRGLSVAITAGKQDEADLSYWEVESNAGKMSRSASRHSVVNLPRGPSMLRSAASQGRMGMAASGRLHTGNHRHEHIQVPELHIPSGKLEDMSAPQRETVLQFLIDRLQGYLTQAAKGFPDISGQHLSDHDQRASARYGRRSSYRYGANNHSLRSEHSVASNTSSFHHGLGSRMPSIMLHSQSANSLAASSAPVNASWPPVNTNNELQQPQQQQQNSAFPETAHPLPGALLPAVQAHGDASSHLKQSHDSAHTNNQVVRSPPSTGKPTLGAKSAHRSSPDVATPATSAPPMPAVEDLLNKVMADVRPWGQKAGNSLSVGGPIAASKLGNVFVKKPVGSPRA